MCINTRKTQQCILAFSAKNTKATVTGVEPATFSSAN